MKNSIYISSFFILAAFYMLPVAWAAIETVQTGVASVQTDAEIGNIEVLRERAISNAMDLALLEVRGAIVSSEKAASLRSKDRIVIENGKSAESTQQESRFNDQTLTRNEGHVRILEILEERIEDNQYFIKAKLAVLEPEETTKQLDAGFFWERIGKPDIALQIHEPANQKTSHGNSPSHTLRFFRDVLTKNSLQTAEGTDSSYRYQVSITQETNPTVVKRFGTYTTHCQLSFRISDSWTGADLIEERSSHGPQAGFSAETATQACLKQIAPSLSEKLVRSLARTFDDKWTNGDEYVLEIRDLPGNYLSDVTDAVKQAFRVRQGQLESYSNGMLSLKVRYRGEGTELSQALISAFDDLGHQVMPSSIALNVIGLTWLNSKIDKPGVNQYENQ